MKLLVALNWFLHWDLVKWGIKKCPHKLGVTVHPTGHANCIVCKKRRKNR